MSNIITKRIKFKVFLRKWRKANKHNLTTPKKIIDLDLVQIGLGTYGIIDIDSWRNPKEKLIIGKYCSIACDVKFILGGNHHYETLSTFPFSYLYEKRLIPPITKGVITIEDGVWIGTRAMVLSGVTIGKGAIVGAGCIVSKDIPAYAIVIGNPMKIVKYRFPETIRERLKRIDYYDLIDKDFYIRNKMLIDSTLSEVLINMMELEAARKAWHNS